MTFSDILSRLATLVDDRLPAAHPLCGRVWGVVADPKQGQHTWAVIEATGSPRDIVPGNFTMQTDGRLWAIFFPPEGQWSAAEVEAYMEEAALALVGACSALCTQPHREGETFLVLDCFLTGAGTTSAKQEGGFVVEVPFSLTVQF